MATKARVFTTNAVLARKLCRGIQLGSRFVFLDMNQIAPEPFDFDTAVHPALASGQLGRMTIGLSSFHRTSLPGIAFRAAEDLKLHLRSLTTDRDLYRYLHDVVSVLVIDLKAQARQREVAAPFGIIFFATVDSPLFALKYLNSSACVRDYRSR